MVKDKGGRFEKSLMIRIHYSHSLVFKKYFFENHVHTLTELPFYTGPKDTVDPVDIKINDKIQCIQVIQQCPPSNNVQTKKVKPFKMLRTSLKKLR